METEKLVKSFKAERTPKEKKKSRLIIIALFGLTLISIGVASGKRGASQIFERLNQPATVISQRFSPAPASPTPTPSLEKEKKAVEEMLVPLRGTYAVYFEDLLKGSSFSINGINQLSAASLIKMPVLVALYREAEAGRLDLETVYKLKAADKREGAGSLGYKPVGYAISYRKMAELMGKQSDNTAFHIISVILGEGKIQETIAFLGMKNTSFADQITSAEDIGLLFRKLYSGKVLADENKNEILSFITNTIWEDRIPAGVPEGIKVSHKIGTLVGVISDAGIVFAPKPFILVIMSDGANEIEAKNALPEITKKIYNLFEEAPGKAES